MATLLRQHRLARCPSDGEAYEAIADVVLELVEWGNGTAVAYAEAVADGGHVSYSSEADARKGATSNGLKKAASMFGCGWQAFAGVIDDDNVPSDAVALPSTSSPRPVVQAAPVAAAPTQPQQTPPGYVRVGAPVDTRPQQADRNRLSSKQLAAIMSIGRKLGVEPSALRSRVKSQFGCQLEFISREQASLVIKSLDAQLNGNGSGHHADEPQSLPS